MFMVGRDINTNICAKRRRKTRGLKFWLLDNVFLKWGPTPASFCLFPGFSDNQYNFFATNQCEKMSVYPVYGIGIQTLDLSNMSRLP